jgi:hypothetical protein
VVGDAVPGDRESQLPQGKNPGIAVVPTAMAHVSRGISVSFGGTPKDVARMVGPMPRKPSSQVVTKTLKERWDYDYDEE